jgi:hypothetical protein
MAVDFHSFHLACDNCRYDLKDENGQMVRTADALDAWLASHRIPDATPHAYRQPHETAV